MTRLQFYRLENSAKTTDLPMSGSAVKNHGWLKRWRHFLQNEQFRTSCCCRVVRQFWYYFVFNIDNKSSGNWRDSPKTHPKRWTSIEPRTTGCETFKDGWSSSQKISSTQKCLHPPTFLRTQIRNVLRKWYQNQGNIVFMVTSQKTELAKSACEPRWQRAPCRRLNEEGEWRNDHQYAVVVQDLANPIRVKQRLHKRRKRVYESSWSRHTSQKLFTQAIHWSLAHFVKIYRGIIELQHLTEC